MNRTRGAYRENPAAIPEGLAVAMERKPDLLLLDIMMPKLDGIEVCRRLKGDPSLPFIPIILVTAKAEEAGCDAYFSKPVSPRALLAKVREYIG